MAPHCLEEENFPGLPFGLLVGFKSFNRSKRYYAWHEYLCSKKAEKQQASVEVSNNLLSVCHAEILPWMKFWKSL